MVKYGLHVDNNEKANIMRKWYLMNVLHRKEKNIIPWNELNSCMRRIWRARLFNDFFLKI